jgi:hypothetical protein
MKKAAVKKAQAHASTIATVGMSGIRLLTKVLVGWM